MSKTRKSVIFIITAAIFAIIAIAMGASAGTTAFADGERVTIAKNPTDVTGVYGSVEKTLKIELSDPNAIATFAWYKSKTMTDVAEKVSGGTSATPSITVKNATDSGYYYCVVTAIKLDGETYATNIVSAKAKVSINKKPIEVNTVVKEFVYNGKWQKPEVKVKKEGIISGDEVTATTETMNVTIDAGKYEATIILDNPQYCVSGNDIVAFEIKKAPLSVKIKEVAVKAGLDYDLSIEYDGFVAEENESALGFIPKIPYDAYGIKRAGIYSFVCSGARETKNYKITYEKSNVYVNEAVLKEKDISGITATAGGSFRGNTKINVTTGNSRSKFFLRKVKYNYNIEFASGGADGDTYVINIQDDSISKFMLAVCKLNEDGRTERVKAYTQDGGILSVTLPTDEACSIVIYNDYTIIVVLGLIVLIVIISVIAVSVASKRKYKRHLALYRAAEREADKYR